MSRRVFIVFAFLSVAVGSFAVATPVAHAATTFTWSGAGTTDNWSDANNWVGNVAPSAGDDLVFPRAAARQSNVNDFALYTDFNSISIAPSGTGIANYTFSGHALTVDHGITNHGYQVEFDLAVRLGADQTFSATTGSLSLSGAPGSANGIDFNGHALTISGAGGLGWNGASGVTPSTALTLNGPGLVQPTGPNSFTGATVVNGGSAKFDSTSYASTITANGGTINGSGRIGDLVVHAATLSNANFEAQNLRLDSSSTVAVNADPTFTPVIVHGTTDLGGARLNLDLYGSWPNGITKSVIQDLHGATGTFAGLSDGAFVTSNAITVHVQYAMGVSIIAGGPAQLTPIGWRSGYWMLDAAGETFAFGDMKNYGRSNVVPAWFVFAVKIEPTSHGTGYWLLSSNGAVEARGDAVAYGNAALLAGERATSLSATPSNGGYWVFTNRGRVITKGDAVSYGDLSGRALNGDVLGSIATPSGKGYYMVAADGGVFAFGDAAFRGSMGSVRLNQPVKGLVPTATNLGYWLVASDGGIFAFGDAVFRGSMGSTKLNKPVVGMVRYGNGYLMVGSDGGIFNFSDQPFAGSLGAAPPASPVTSVAAWSGFVTP